ncbi:MAG: hypothetical protein Kow0026_09600 [Oricola sp.]
MIFKKIQQALKNKGIDPGPRDGFFGPLTRGALKIFQRNNGIDDSGKVDRDTFAKLLPDVPWPRSDKGIPPDLPWMIEAGRLAGIREEPGPASNPTIMNWAKALDLSYASDEVPWCGLFVGHCVASQLPEEPLPAGLLGARSWLGFGHTVAPQFGAVLVFWRGSKDDWRGHVGFCFAQDDTHYHVLGGNQSNKVNVSRFPRKRLLDARWPNSVVPAGIVRSADKAGVLISVSEQ